MVFQKPNPFPKSIYENVAYGLRVRGISKRAVLGEKVERALTDAALWTEAKDRLHNTLKDQVTIIIVTHNMQQAARVSNFTAFMYLGHLEEFDRTEKIFTTPSSKLTEEYITGRFG